MALNPSQQSPAPQMGFFSKMVYFSVWLGILPNIPTVRFTDGIIL